MQPHFTLDVEAAHRLPRFMAAGFFPIEQVERIGLEKVAALRELGGEPKDHVSIVDVRACRIQSQEVADAFARVIRDPRYAARRVAFVVGSSSLARLQIRRMLAGVDSARMFETSTEAEAWLFGEEQVSVAA